MLEIYNGREKFYQWDVNQKVIVDDDIIAVQYDNGTGDALVCGVYELDGVKVADVPNIMLQTYWAIHAYAYCGECVRGDKVYEVEKRSRPDDYVYTETETLRYSTLYERVKTLEEQHIEEVGSVAAQIEEVNSRIDELEQRPTGGSGNVIRGTLNYTTENGAVIQFDKTAAEMYEIGNELNNYDVYMRNGQYEYKLASANKNTTAVRKNVFCKFLCVAEDRIKTIHILIYENGTIDTGSYVETSRIIYELPNPNSVENGKKYNVYVYGNRYQLEEEVEDSGSTGGSTLIVLMAYDMEGQLIQDGQKTVEEIFGGLADTTDINNVKLMTMNTTTQDIMCYSVAKVETSTMSIYFTNGIDTPIKMNADGTLVYIA